MPRDADARQPGTFQGEIVVALENKGDINGDGVVNYIMIEGDPENPDAQYRTQFSVKALEDAQLQLRPGKVHALMGENGAGKSTLMKCMFGIYKMDEGEILMNGEPVVINNPIEALHKGIAMVHQELQPIPARTIGENIFLGRYPMKKALGFIPMVDHDKMYADTAELLKKVRMNFDPRQKLGELSVSQMQSVEIAKAVSANCRVLILDEPTSSLTQNEVEALFRIVEDLKADGVAIVYISHKMDEILRISDDVTIMRDGHFIGTWPASELTTDKIITKMVGRELTNLYPERENVPGEVVFRVEDFTSINPKSFRHVNFELRKGEILGVGGLVGAQRTNLINGRFGNTSGFHLPYLLFVAAFFGVLFWFIYNKTTHGKYMYAIGGNEVAAEVSGVNTRKTTTWIYVTAGLMYAMAGYLLAAKSGGASASLGNGYELEAIAGCTIGGVSTTGGIGTVSGVLVGVLVFELLKIVLQFLGVNPYYNYIVQGLVIVVAVALDIRKYIAKK